MTSEPENTRRMRESGQDNTGHTRMSKPQDVELLKDWHQPEFVQSKTQSPKPSSSTTDTVSSGEEWSDDGEGKMDFSPGQEHGYTRRAHHLIHSLRNEDEVQSVNSEKQQPDNKPQEQESSIAKSEESDTDNKDVMSVADRSTSDKSVSHDTHSRTDAYHVNTRPHNNEKRRQRSHRAGSKREKIRPQSASTVSGIEADIDEVKHNATIILASATKADSSTSSDQPNGPVAAREDLQTAFSHRFSDNPKGELML